MTRLERAKLQLQRAVSPQSLARGDWFFFYEIVNREKQKLMDIMDLELAAQAIKPSWAQARGL